MGLLISWLFLSIGVLVAAAIVPGFQVRGVNGAVLTAALFGILNFFLGWFFFVVLGIATLGVGFLLASVTRIIVYAIVLKIADAMTDKLTIKGFGSAFLAAIVMTLVAAGGELLMHPAFRHHHWF